MPARRTEFYRHDRHWTNRLILGDSLLVMTSLAEKERLKGRVRMIYLDPPYGIKFGSNWPKKGKIAVKVINHYGDEVLKVYPAGG